MKKLPLIAYLVLSAGVLTQGMRLKETPLRLTPRPVEAVSSGAAETADTQQLAAAAQRTATSSLKPAAKSATERHTRTAQIARANTSRRTNAIASEDRSLSGSIRKTASDTMAAGRRKLMRGIASFYASSLHGRRTANGEQYDENKLTAAHRSIPHGTKVRVRNLRNGRSVVVRINDRGPHLKGRIIDLSARAAKELQMYRQGIGMVEIEVLAP